jgi:hypothetical protein
VESQFGQVLLSLHMQLHEQLLFWQVASTPVLPSPIDWVQSLPQLPQFWLSLV